MNYLNLHNKIGTNEIKENYPFFDENIIINEIDYYYSNVIARASFTMSECRNKKNEQKKTGTEG